MVDPFGLELAATMVVPKSRAVAEKILRVARQVQKRYLRERKPLCHHATMPPPQPHQCSAPHQRTTPARRASAPARHSTTSTFTSTFATSTFATSTFTTFTFTTYTFTTSTFTTYTFTILRPVHSSIHPSIHPSIHASMHPSICCRPFPRGFSPSPFLHSPPVRAGKQEQVEAKVCNFLTLSNCSRGRGAHRNMAAVLLPTTEGCELQ